MSNKVSPAFQKDYRAACSSRAARAAAEEGRTWEVRRQQKNGKLGSPSEFDVNLSEDRAAARKADLERMNPGSSYLAINTAR
jgi:hypothetical protein